MLSLGLIFSTVSLLWLKVLMFNFLYEKSTCKSDLLAIKGRSKRVNQSDLFCSWVRTSFLEKEGYVWKCVNQSITLLPLSLISHGQKRKNNRIYSWRCEKKFPMYLQNWLRVAFWEGYWIQEYDHCVCFSKSCLDSLIY